MYCGTRLWMVTPDGQRFTYVLTMKGQRDGKAVDERILLVQADEVIAKDAATFKTAFKATAACLVVILVGLALVIVAALVFVAVVWLLNVMQ